MSMVFFFSVLKGARKKEADEGNKDKTYYSENKDLKGIMHDHHKKYVFHDLKTEKW
jgi:hypothetical protein